MKCFAFKFVLLVLTEVASSSYITRGDPHYSKSVIDESRRALCVIQPCNSSTHLGMLLHGIIEITQPGPNDPVSLSGTIRVNTEHDVSGEHGFHIHEFGVPNGNCAEAAGHYNPFGKDHGAPDAVNRHVGDLGNIVMTKVKDGIYNSHVNISDSLVTLFGDYSVGGRAIVLHIGEDDLGYGGEDDSLTTGHAGARIACCTINMVPCHLQC